MCYFVNFNYVKIDEKQIQSVKNDYFLIVSLKIRETSGRLSDNRNNHSHKNNNKCLLQVIVFYKQS